MKKIAVLLAQGFEEGEALLTADVLRRAGMDCRLVSLAHAQVTGSHGITVFADETLDACPGIEDYDMLVLPGGLPGAEHLRDDARVLALLRRFDAQGKYLAAICAAPIALHAAGVTTGRNVTSYPDRRYEALFTDAHYTDAPVVRDGHIITSRGPATTLPFAYALVEALGGDAQPLRDGMLYTMMTEYARA